MAIGLPYFKFFCSEWSDGDITLEDYNIQGLFINICSYYWSNECEVNLSKLKKRFKYSKEEIDYLIKEELIKVNLDSVSINFLDEQKEDRDATSKSKSRGGKASAESRRLKKIQEELLLGNQLSIDVELTEEEHMLKLRSTEEQLLREDKKRKEKITKGKTKKQKIEGFLNWFNNYKKKETGNIGKFKMLSTTDENNLFKLLTNYNHLDFEKAIPNLYANQWARESNNITPTHFLRNDNFNKYLNTEKTFVNDVNQQPAN